MKKTIVWVFCIIAFYMILLTIFRLAFGRNNYISIYGIVDIFNNFDLRVPFSWLLDNFSVIGNGYTWNVDSTFFSNIIDAVNYGFQFLLIPVNIIVGVFRFMFYIYSFVINLFVYLLGFNPFITL